LIPQPLGLRALQVIDVGTGSIPADDVPMLVEERLGADQEPPVDAVMASQTKLGLVRLSRGEASAPPLHRRRQVVGMERDLPSRSGGLLLGQTRLVLPSLVEKYVRAIREVGPRQHRDRVDDPAELRVCGGGGGLRTLQVVDVRTGPVPP